MAAIVFYDGTCALCHGLVRWVLARDRDAAFHFAPLQGATFTRLVSPEQRAGLPDSVVARDRFGKLHVQSDAIYLILVGLGRLRTAALFGLLPRPLRDLGYRVIARARYALFGRKDELCPIVPPELQGRFLP